MKSLKCQTCEKTHQSYRGAAKCRFKSAYQDGEGPYATLHYNTAHHYGLLVSLHKTKENAIQYAKQAFTGREGGVLCHSDFNGIWCFTRDGRWMKIVNPWEIVWEREPKSWDVNLQDRSMCKDGLPKVCPYPEWISPSEQECDKCIDEHIAELGKKQKAKEDSKYKRRIDALEMELLAAKACNPQLKFQEEQSVETPELPEDAIGQGWVKT